MTAEAEVCNGAVSEVAGIEEKSEFKAGSFQPELNGIGNHDQANDPENSYVLVTDVDVLSADSKDMAAVDGSPRHESSATIELLGTELDALNGKQESANAMKHGNAEGGDESFPLVNGGGDQDTVKEENQSLEELNDENGKFDAVNGEVDPTLTECRIGNAESADEDTSVAKGILVGVEGSVRDEDEFQVKLAISKPECGAESEIKKAEDSDGKIERSDDTVVVEFEDQNGKIGFVAEAELDKVEDQMISEASPGVEENQESNIPNLGLVADSGEQETLLSPFKNQETVKDEAVSASGKEALQDQKCHIDPESDIESGLDKGKVVVSNADCNVGTACDEVLEGKDEGIFSVSHVEGNFVHPEDAVKHRHDNGATPKISVSERETGASWPIQNLSASSAVVDRPTAEVQISDTETFGVISSSPVDGSESESFGNGPISLDSLETCSVNGVSSGSDSAIGMVVSNEKEPILQGRVLSGESEDSHKPPVSAVKLEPEAHNSESESFGNMPIRLDSLETCSVNGVSSGSDSAIRMVVSNEKEPILQGRELSGESEDSHKPPVSAVKLEPEAHNSSAADRVAVSSDQDATGETEVLDSFDKCVSISTLESADVKDMLGGATGSDDETLLLAKNGDTGNSHSVVISMASLESSSDTVTGEHVSGVSVIKPFNFFVRIPRYSDEKLQEQIRIADLEVREKTKLRDSIQAQIQEKRAKNQSNGIDYEYAKGEDRSVKKLLKGKRMEIDSLQSVINKAKNATSIEDLNSRIKTIEHMIEHETVPLKEEKQFIKQLKQLREQLSSSKCSQKEIQQSLEQREQAEERLKTLRKELGNLKHTASKAQTACDDAESKYNVEHKKVKELQAQFRGADDVRQEAYAKFLCLSKELSQKRKDFAKFKNDGVTATYYAFTDDREALYRHCANEVENFMELWNGDDQFRREYVRLNTRSTLRRFGTFDGRSLGPDEKPPILPSYATKRNDKMASVPADADSISKSPTMELKPETKIENMSSDIHSSKKETESKKKTVTTEGFAKSELVNNLATVSGMDEVQEEEKEPMKTKEELELIRKAEEIRREEAEAKLEEQRRLEEIAKAKEARERKQRRDEKAQKREELRARKEAELKEKEREKKLRKKERKNAASASTDVQDDTSSITCVDTSKEEASIQVNDISTKKPKTSRVMVSKKNKTRSAPPPSLRNRNRRKWQQWMWVTLISLVVLVLFWLGNMGVFSSVNSKLQGTGF